MVTPLCGVSSDEKPFPVVSRYLVPLMEKLPITTVPPGVVVICGLAGVIVSGSGVLVEEPW